ncbi:MAG: tRNA guanosine(34) transglycosylase Tgt [Patescibacteria group bacterium]|nr:tRNA guanosine(34) transglycosylase Tgt [Patescibacteria group bacterium]
MSGYKLTQKNYRHGRISTAHGILSTPFFMPDATRAYIKGNTSADVKRVKTEAMVVNTFHLYLQPGRELIKKAGGIHSFMNWHKPLLSDSGGFQVFSLIHRAQGLGKIDDEKVSFKSPINGERHELTPEKSIQIQFDLGVDMMVCLDDCPPNDWPKEKLEVAVKRSLDWAARCKIEYLKQLKKRKIIEAKRPLLFAVVQGGDFEDLRFISAQKLIAIGFDGYGFGARPVDKDGNFLADTLFKTASFLPEKSLRFALGVGTPEDIYRCYLMGWDMFDCVIPTREGRHGKLFYFDKKFKGFKKPVEKIQAISKYPKFYHSLNISNAAFAQDFSAINPDSELLELRQYSKAFLHHLFKLKEPLGQKLASLNNLEFYNRLMRELRKI